MESRKFKIGQHVQSHYRARGYGTVTRIEKRNGTNPLITVVVTHDVCGRPQRKNFVKKLDSSWLTIIHENDCECFKQEEE